MQSTISQNHNTMNTFITTLNIYDYERFRDRCIAECNISRTTWSNWRNGSSITDKYKPIIDKVSLELFGRTVFGKGGAE